MRYFNGLYGYLEPYLKLTLLALVCWQFYSWRAYTLEVTWLQLKDVLKLSNIEDQMEFGAICNSLGRFECSVEKFDKVLSQNAMHRGAKGNIALALTELARHEEAIIHFRSYFDGGGQAVDVMRGYAQALASIGQWDRGIQWLYSALGREPANVVIANDLVDYLALVNREEEALSLIGGLIHRQGGQHDPFWSSKLEVISHSERKIDPEENLAKSKIRILGLSPKVFLVPLRLGANSRVHFFKADISEAKSQLPEDFCLDGACASEKDLSRGLASADSKSKQISLGSWVSLDAELEACRSCEAVLGQDILKRFHFEVTRENGLDLLILSRP